MLRQITTTLTSRNLKSTDNRQSTTWVSRFSGKRASLGLANEASIGKGTDGIALQDFPEEELEGNWKRTQSFGTDMSDTDHKLPASPMSPLEAEWGTESADMRQGASRQSRDTPGREQDALSSFRFAADIEVERGLSLPPTQT